MLSPLPPPAVVDGLVGFTDEARDVIVVFAETTATEVVVVLVVFGVDEVGVGGVLVVEDDPVLLRVAHRDLVTSTS